MFRNIGTTYIWKIFAHPGALKGSSFTVLCQAFSSIRLVLSVYAFELRTRNIQVRCSIVDEMGAMGFGGGEDGRTIYKDAARVEILFI